MSNPLDGSGNLKVSTQGTAAVSGQLITVRGTTIHHRTAITAIDKLLVPAAPAVVDVTSGGSLASGTAYAVAVAASNRYGSTTSSTTGAVTTSSANGAVHVVQVTVAQVANAEFYELFLSTAANPLWVARITEAQRAAGCTVTAVATVSATSPGAGLVNIQVVGTGVASNAAPFTFNNAYTPQLVTPVAMPAGYTTLEFSYSLTLTDLRSAPSLAVILWKQNPTTLDYHMTSTNFTTALLTALRQPLIQSGATNVQGAPNFVATVDAISGQGASVDIYVTPISPP